MNDSKLLISFIKLKHSLGHIKRGLASVPNRNRQCRALRQHIRGEKARADDFGGQKFGIAVFGNQILLRQPSGSDQKITSQRIAT